MPTEDLMGLAEATLAQAVIDTVVGPDWFGMPARLRRVAEKLRSAPWSHHAVKERAVQRALDLEGLAGDIQRALDLEAAAPSRRKNG